MMSESLNEKILWALTPEAARAVKELEQKGIDQDLALELLSKIWPEPAIYELDDETC